jgi:hypothetical protein
MLLFPNPLLVLFIKGLLLVDLRDEIAVFTNWRVVLLDAHVKKSSSILDLGLAMCVWNVSCRNAFSIIMWCLWLLKGSLKLLFVEEREEDTIFIN